MQFRGRAVVCRGLKGERKERERFKKEMRRSEDQYVASRAARYIVRGVTRILCESTFLLPRLSHFSLILFLSFLSTLTLIFLLFFFPSFLPFSLTFFLRPHTSFFLAVFHFLREKNRSTGCYPVGNHSRRGIRGRVCLQFCK